MKSQVVSLLLSLILGMSIGAFRAYSQCDYPVLQEYGYNGPCHVQSFCGGSGWMDFYCIWMSCYVTGEDIANGCPSLRYVSDCIWLGCYNFLEGNCVGC